MKFNELMQRPRSRGLLRLGGHLALGFFSGLCALDGRTPLAAGLLSALRPGGGMLAALAGATLGSFAVLTFGQSLRCWGSLVLIASVLSAFQDTIWYRHALFRPLTAALSTLAVELAYAIRLGLTGEALVRLGASTALAGLLSHYCALLLRETSIPRRRTSREGEALRRRLQLSAQALRSLCESFGAPPRPSEENPAVVFDRAAEVVCRGCALRELCWSREYISTFNAFNDATPAILERGRAESRDFADHFAHRCIHLPQLISAINTEVTALLLRRQYRRQLEQERSRTRGQYAHLTELVAQTMAAPPPTPAAGKERPFDVALGSQPRSGQRLCGDSVTWFRGEGSSLYLLLSDGMGSGREARRESQLTVRLMEQFLTAGVQPESALRTLNAALQLRCDDQGSFTTIDLLSLDLGGGQAALFKYGAAPTYLKRGGSVRRLTGSSLPAGLQDSAAVPAPDRFPLEDGSFLLMVSDGVADNSDDQWLQDLLAGWRGEDPNVLVSLVLRECAQRRQGSDDCSAICLYLPPRERDRRQV